MENQIILDSVGYIGAVLMAIALINDSLLRLRWFSIAGNILFIIYGYLIGSYPVIAVNILIAIANGYYIQKLVFNKEYLKISRV